jgi:acyl-CoA thioesterase YciA
MPADANPSGDIFGGWVLSQMDIAGGIHAGQRAQGRVATVAIEAMHFIKPVHVGDVLCVYAAAERVGRTSLAIRLEAWALRRRLGDRVKVTEGIFTFVALDGEGRPAPIAPDRDEEASLPQTTLQTRLHRQPMKERKMSDSKSKSNDADWGFAGFDFAKLIESCQISGVDMTALIDTEKKNIDALMEVNRSAYDGWRNLMAQQAEVFQETMKAIAAEAGGESVAGRRTEIAREGFEKALANMRQLAETATESQKQTMEILRRRFEDGMAAMRNPGARA